MIAPGYFPPTYWPDNYWDDDYWADYGTAVTPTIPTGATRRRRPIPIMKRPELDLIAIEDEEILIFL